MFASTLVGRSAWRRSRTINFSTLLCSERLVHDGNAPCCHVVAAYDVLQRLLTTVHLWVVLHCGTKLCQFVDVPSRDQDVVIEEHRNGVRARILSAGVHHYTHGVNDIEVRLVVRDWTKH